MKHLLKPSTDPKAESTWHVTGPLQTTPGPLENAQKDGAEEDIFPLPPTYG